MFPDQLPWRNESRDFTGPEFRGQSPDVAVNRFVLQIRIHLITTDYRDVDPRIQRTGKTRDQSTFAVPGHGQRRPDGPRLAAGVEPIHRCENFLNFIPLNGSPHLIGGAPKHLPLRLFDGPNAGHAAVRI